MNYTKSTQFALLGGTPYNFGMKPIHPTKTRGMGLPYAKNFIILISTVFD